MRTVLPTLMLLLALLTQGLAAAWAAPMPLLAAQAVAEAQAESPPCHGGEPAAAQAPADCCGDDCPCPELCHGGSALPQTRSPAAAPVTQTRTGMAATTSPLHAHRRAHLKPPIVSPA